VSQLPDVNDLADFQAKDPQQALDAALAAVRSYCGWDIAPSQSATVTVWCLDGRTLNLPTLNLTAVASVVQDGVTVAPTGYTFESYGVIRANYGACFSRLTRVTVAFTHGYAAMPDAAAAVVLSLAQRSLNDSRGLVVRPGSASSASVGALVETYGPVLTEADKQKLSDYAIAGGFA
jgi:hypothetical protein